MTSLIASTFWSIAAEGEGSIRGLRSLESDTETDTKTIMIQVLLNCPSQGNADEILNGPIRDTLNGAPLCLLTGANNDCDHGEILDLEPFVTEPTHRGRRRLGYGGSSGKCKKCSKNRRALKMNQAFTGALTSATKQWCKDMDRGSTNPCCKGNVISSVSYNLS